MQVFDSRICQLGEGALWHPLQQRWYWFDILAPRLLARDDQGTYAWSFSELVSAAGWIDERHLLIASATQLFRFCTLTGTQDTVVSLEGDNPVTRSNDGRADPWGGFWIGTMGKDKQFQAGAIYRYYQGQLVRLYDRITISNALCFSHDRRYAYFTDTPTQTIMRQPLDSKGWPAGQAQVHIDLTGTGFMPDGAVIDVHGNLWNAQWGSARVACYNPAGEFVTALHAGAWQASCPAFGGAGMDHILITTAADGADPQDTLAGQCFIHQDVQLSGQPEYAVLL